MSHYLKKRDEEVSGKNPVYEVLHMYGSTLKQQIQFHKVLVYIVWGFEHFATVPLSVTQMNLNFLRSSLSCLIHDFIWLRLNIVFNFIYASVSFCHLINCVFQSLLCLNIDFVQPNSPHVVISILYGPWSFYEILTRVEQQECYTSLLPHIFHKPRAN